MINLKGEKCAFYKSTKFPALPCKSTNHNLDRETMAEAAMFSVAAKLLVTIASPAFKKAYKKACSIKSAREDLNKLERSIETIQAVLLDAEKKQDSSAAIKNWIKRVRDVLYDADDLFDEVATDDMLRKQVKGNKLMKKVRAFTSSSLNPLVSSNSIAEKVKDIRRSLLEISEDMKPFQFVESIKEKPVSGTRNRQDPGLLFVGSEKVIGRDKDKKAILEMFVAESSRDVSVIAIVGIGGMGKTTLAQLVYNDDEVDKNFNQNRWFACISDTSDDKEVIGKIYQSTCNGKYDDLTIIDLQNQIKEAIKGRKFLLVLDDVWDDDRGRWQGRMSLLSGGAKGSKVVVTTRSVSVARAVGAVETHHLKGLSEEESWDLFKSIVSFTPEQERDSRWANLGREIVKKCANVPLAIKSIASLLFDKNTIEEWESFMSEELSRLGQNHNDGIMPVLKLSYDHLPSNLKHCFAYCSLFPKDHSFNEDELVYLWISQGYIKPNNDNQNIEDVGHSYFMDLLRRSFFQYEISARGIKWLKMHDLIHDLAQHVAGEESNLLTTSSNESNGTRHVSVAYAIDDSWADSHQLHNVNRLRSFLYRGDYSSPCKLTLEKQFANFKSLRALSLAYLNIENVPSSIGGLKHLRYLDISCNTFKYLPEAITKLVNLSTLNISCCRELEALPSHFRKLINLRNLINYGCLGLMHMPPGFEELTSLQCLDCFRVGIGTDGGQLSKLDVLSVLKLRGELTICFEEDTGEWGGVECWQPPLTLQHLMIFNYKGLRLPHWGNERIDNQCQAFPLPQLTTLYLYQCSGVKFLPPFRHLPNLNALFLREMEELEYIDGEEEEGKQSPCASSLPNLKNLRLADLPKLKGWSRKVETRTRSKEENVAAFTSTCAPPQLLSFPTLCELRVKHCPELSHMLLCPSLHKLKLNSVKAEVIHQFLPIQDNSSSLESIVIEDCDELVSFPGESLMSLQHLKILSCPKMKQLHLARVGVVGRRQEGCGLGFPPQTHSTNTP